MSFLKQSTGRGAKALLLATLLSISLISFATDDGGARKVKTKVTPAYPEVARQMNISGVVRLEVEIASNGSVKSVKALGGHPLLIDAAVDAVKKWKYEAGTETTNIVEIKFTNQQ